MVEVLLDFKWLGAARRQFVSEFIYHSVHLIVVVIWNLRASSTALLPITTITSNPDAYLDLFFCFAWNTFTMITMVWAALQAIRIGGPLRYLADKWNQIDLVYILMQLTVNVLFWTRENMSSWIGASGITPLNSRFWLRYVALHAHFAKAPEALSARRPHA